VSSPAKVIAVFVGAPFPVEGDRVYVAEVATGGQVERYTATWQETPWRGDLFSRGVIHTSTPLGRYNVSDVSEEDVLVVCVPDPVDPAGGHHAA